jgi:mannose-1-phosphate guanylyltransferase
MRAVVLVGGFGTRLRPLTYAIPKPMLPVGHRPILEHLVEELAGAGVTDVSLALGFKPEPFLAAFPDGVLHGIRLHYAVEPTPLDTAGAIRFAAIETGIDDTFVVVNGDVLTDLDVSGLVAFHRLVGAEGTLHLTPVEDPSAFGVVDFGEGSRVHRFVEKPPLGEAPSNLINAGTYVLEPSVLERIAPDRPVSIEREVFPAMVEAGTLYAMATDDYWVDTGRPDTYRLANLDLVDGLRRRGACDGVAPGAQIAPDAVVAHSVVAAGARVDAGARVVDSVVLPGAHVGAGALVEASVLMGDVGAGACTQRLVLGAGASVPAGATLVDVRVPDPDGG